VATATRKTKQPATLSVPALEVRQGENRRLYSFAIDGKLLHEFCTISRVSRHDGEGLNGYQRPEVVSHITQIREYLESDNPLLPNAIVVAFDDTVRFKPSARKSNGASYSRAGTLEIPIRHDIADKDKPGWIVDGQQRAAALRDARVTGFPEPTLKILRRGDSNFAEIEPEVRGTLPRVGEVARLMAITLITLSGVTPPH